MAVAGSRAKAWTVGLVLSLLALCVLTAAMRGMAAAYAKEAESLYRQKRVEERKLGELRAEVRRLKSPAEIDARLEAMKSGKTQASPASLKVSKKEAPRGR